MRELTPSRTVSRGCEGSGRAGGVAWGMDSKQPLVAFAGSRPLPSASAAAGPGSPASAVSGPAVAEGAMSGSGQQLQPPSCPSRCVPQGPDWGVGGPLALFLLAGMVLEC